MEEHYFADESIVSQSTAVIASDGMPKTNGISIIVFTSPGVDGVEVLLEYDELKDALAALDADREAFPELYEPNAEANARLCRNGDEHEA